MHSIKKELIAICEEIIERNNKPYEESQEGVSNHVFDEKGVQMYVGWELTRTLSLYNTQRKLHNLQFEKKFINEDSDKKDYLDIFLFHNDKKIGIELKFKTKGFHLTKKGSSKKDPKATRKEQERFNYYFSNQGAETNGKHSFFWDLHRLNNLIKKKEIDLGYQIFVTNHPGYWSNKNRVPNEKYIIELKNGKAQISATKKVNNSDKFDMSHGTRLIKEMSPPNWLSVDNISGQKGGLVTLQKNLLKIQKDKKVLYSEKIIKLDTLTDEKIEWLPCKIKHEGKEYDNPARSEKNKNREFDLFGSNNKKAMITKFAFTIVELKKPDENTPNF
jgi:hypothetical protein